MNQCKGPIVGLGVQKRYRQTNCLETNHNSSYLKMWQWLGLMEDLIRNTHKLLQTSKHLHSIVTLLALQYSNQIRQLRETKYLKRQTLFKGKSNFKTRCQKCKNKSRLVSMGLSRDKMAMIIVIAFVCLTIL